ncbi:uncharacterized protein si:ch211-214p13.7 [Pimephales promelas]|uniref:uncharacterized protein si:ch211-214p13.7 n=1 Tax=Pimephales promelas TaxID=90988 RepID=UPI001955EB4F|nr:uncharacterized protein si:ch211-214p13.7 [Pimephales promelas]XP_039539579.1 uncharacterized protein si:ch211-214p13.7 [Pimephales promelas]
MGNLCCKRRNKKLERAEDNDNQTATAADTKTEDVLYASIDHTTIHPERPVQKLEDNDCDYAVVKLPQNTTDMAKQKSNEDCSDDYVLMG